MDIYVRKVERVNGKPRQRRDQDLPLQSSASSGLYSKKDFLASRFMPATIRPANNLESDPGLSQPALPE
jgi:hypothetical protein